ncbi:PQQ-dependent sugar dehydrogenase [Phreatobacter cathodiphilus]|nr:PQQ-dependent sugar dehydrogenase [Phreatobacter cathodiphilus]
MSGSGPHRRAVLASGLSAAALLGLTPRSAAARTVRADSPGQPLAVTTVAGSLEHPWGLAFLPDGSMLVTERPGRLRRIMPDGEVSKPLEGGPRVLARGQGGLLGIALAPDFARNRQIFLSFAEAREGSTNATAVYRGRLSVAGDALEDGRVIWRQQPAFASSNHFGSRIVADRSGHLFVTTGDRFSQMDLSQDPSNTIAKIVRITADGEPALDNPRAAGRSGWAPEVWAIGLRNVQGAALHPESGLLWVSNHGPRGGDGLYAVRPGENYGWPLISWGTHYDGRPVNGGLREREGLVQPLVHWTPSIAPAGLTFYTGDLMPAWKGSAFSGALAGRMLVRIMLDGERVVGQQRLLTDLGHRFRDVQAGPDGALWALTDARDGALLRIAPPEG